MEVLTFESMTSTEIRIQRAEAFFVSIIRC